MAAAYWAVVPAAGSGQRMGAAIPKQYLPLADRPVLAWTLEALLLHPRIAGVVLAVAADDYRWRACIPEGATSRVAEVIGGTERGDSVDAGLELLARQRPADEWVLVHDAVRPCVHPKDLDRLIAAVEGDAVGGILAAPCTDTIKQADDAARVGATLDRRTLWRALTPQMFRLGALREAYAAARAADRVPTDEAAAIEATGAKPRLVAGRVDNVKVTQPEDLALAEAILRARGKL
jgi:2-C-methyl-D-erythritol 4-phosphate cytidylyltransferase